MFRKDTDQMIRSMMMLSALALSAPAAAQTQMQMNQQATAKWKAADGSMTRQWRVVYAQMKRLDARDTSRGGGFGYAAAALESQRAWLPFRDRQCVIEAAKYAGGSMVPMARARCLTRLTRERTSQFGRMIWRGR